MSRAQVIALIILAMVIGYLFLADASTLPPADPFR